MNLLKADTEEELLKIAGDLANATAEAAIIYLYGPLGAGKTTFTRGFLQKLGYQDKVKSPTYTLVESYLINERTIFHFDLYRLKSAHELEHIGIYDYFSQKAITLIEWPENGFPLLPEPDLACYISFAGKGREIRFVPRTPRGEAILEKMDLQ